MRIGAIVVVAALATWICLTLVRRFRERVDAEDGPLPGLRRRSRTLASVLRGTIIVIIWTVAGISVLDQAGVQVAPILAAAGIAGIALGFGAQSLVRDILAGFFILLESQYDVGDVIRVAGVAGSVEAVNLRTTVLRDEDGSRHVVPNGEIMVSTNLTKVYSRYMLILPVAYEADADRATAVLHRTAEELRADPEYAEAITAPLTVLGVDAYGDASMQVKAFVETLPGEQWRVGRELRRRLKQALDREGIAIPYAFRQAGLRPADGQGRPD